MLVDFPVTESDNDVIAQMMSPEVGKFIARGGHAYHLKEASLRIANVMREHPTHEVVKSLAQYFDSRWALPETKASGSVEPHGKAAPESTKDGDL
ncbi:hypothetical protein SB861_49660 [Paraburkholderia sp. SIMBA_049]